MKHDHHSRKAARLTAALACLLGFVAGPAFGRNIVDQWSQAQATLVWPRELPIEGEPADVVAIVEANAEWLGASANLPKLFIDGDPGTSISGRVREFCRSLPNQREVAVKGLHHLQDDSPGEMGEALRDFVMNLRA